MKQLVLLFLVSLTVACGSVDKIEPEMRELVVRRKIISPSDSTFFGLVMDIHSEGRLIFLADYKNSQVLCLDEDYNLIKTYGTEGNGPGEFRGILGARIFDEKLYILDEGHQEIKVLNRSGDHLMTLDSIMPYRGDFVVVDSLLYGSTFDLSYPPLFISKFVGHEKFTKFYGSHIRMAEGVNLKRERNFMISKWEDQIIAIGENDPVIERYDLNGRLSNILDLSHLSYFEDYLRSIKEKQKTDKKGIASFIVGSEIKDNMLYLLLAGFNAKDVKDESNHILVCEINEDEVKPLELLKLATDNGNEAWYYSFTVLGNKLVAFDAFSYELHEFEL